MQITLQYIRMKAPMLKRACFFFQTKLNFSNTSIVHFGSSVIQLFFNIKVNCTCKLASSKRVVRLRMTEINETSKI